MVRYKIILFLFTISSNVALAQDQYFVFFKDKSGTPYSIDKPSEYLSMRSIARRQKQNITVIEEDLPVNPSYVSQVKSSGATVFFTSRWWNGVLIEANVATIGNVNLLPFVSHSVLVAPGKKLTAGRMRHSKFKRSTSEDVLVNQTQLEQIGLDEMHALGYSGAGIRIAILDAGFIGVDTGDAFSHLFATDRVVQTYNFVNNSTGIYQHHYHGTEVLSVMAGSINGIYAGGVQEAEYLLYVTEDVSSEYRVEEFNWTIAAERADSAGVDLINSSLGYHDFDDATMNYTKSDLDGRTAIVTRAARKAIEKGIVVVNSAGNEGGNSWKLVTAPADADGILAVGSVNAQRVLSGFSSRGPTTDNRIKPDVVAMGYGTVVFVFGVVAKDSGTSFASPLVASLAAGILQAFPALNVEQVYEAIVNSADQANRPDNLMGYGLPHFKAVKNYIESKQSEEVLSVYPNPVSGNSIQIKLKLLTDNPVQIIIFDAQGKRVYEFKHEITWLNNPLEYDVSGLLAGLYLIQVTSGSQTQTIKLVKQ